MKFLLALVLLTFAACSSAPTKRLYKNCEEAGKGSGLYYCEEIPERDMGNRKN